MDIQITINACSNDDPTERAALRRALAIILDCDESAVPEKAVPSETAHACPATPHVDALFSDATQDGVFADPAQHEDENGAKVKLPARIPGQPSPGRKRRTKEEMVEDEAYFAAHPAGGTTTIVYDEEMQKQAGAAVEMNEKALISTGEERVDPAEVEAAEQDAADEAAEAAEKKTGLTHDDLRHAVGRYAKKFGLPQAQAEIPKILGSSIIEVPKTDEALSAAIARVEAAIAGEPVVKAETAEPVHATYDDVMEALKAYAKKFDGKHPVSPAETPIIFEDGPRILQGVFGEGIVSTKLIPNDPVAYGKALTAINKAVLENPYGRTAK